MNLHLPTISRIALILLILSGCKMPEFSLLGSEVEQTEKPVKTASDDIVNKKAQQIENNEQKHADIPFALPTQLQFAGKTYRQIHNQKSDDLRQWFFEYASDGENLQNWRTLITIGYAQIDIKPKEWLAILKATFDKEKPQPRYQLAYDPNNNMTLSQVVYLPSAKYASYESNVWINYFYPACKGKIKYQFSSRHPKELKKEDVFKENKKAAQEIQKNLWIPQCIAN